MKKYLIILYFLFSNLTLFSQDILWGKAYNGLQLGIEDEEDSLVIHVKNVGSQPIKICRHINPKELEFYRVEFSDGYKVVHELFVGTELRKGMQQYDAMLMPGDQMVQKFILKDWSDKNGNKKINQGFYRLTIYYEVSHCYSLSPDQWNGTISAGAIAYQVK